MVKEVNEAAAEYLHLNEYDCFPNDEEACTITPNNVIDFTFSLNFRQVQSFLLFLYSLLAFHSSYVGTMGPYNPFWNLPERSGLDP